MINRDRRIHAARRPRPHHPAPCAHTCDAEAAEGGAWLVGEPVVGFGFGGLAERGEDLGERAHGAGVAFADQ